MSKLYYLKYKRLKKKGSPEHFFHFIWGYLFPALHEIFKLNSSDPSINNEKKFLIMSCGPIMNKSIDEVLSLFNYKYEIVEKDKVNNINYFKQITVPRWDLWLSNIAQRESVKSRKIYYKIVFTELFKKNIPLFINYKIFRAGFLLKIIEIRSSFFERINALDSVDSIDLLSDKYLILKRSPQPQFYNGGGKAEISTYGSNRRELTGIENARDVLTNKNIPVQIYEPGKHSFVEQIKVFQNCKGIIGIKGAEFANLIWMKPKSKVILIWPSNMKSGPIQHALANILGLEYHQTITDEGSFPKLNAESIYQYLKD